MPSTKTKVKPSDKKAEQKRKEKSLLEAKKCAIRDIKKEWGYKWK
jgi:hypothetical protein